MLYFYFVLFLLSLAGMAFTAGRYFIFVRKFSPPELKIRLGQSRSVRGDFDERFLAPLRAKFREVYRPVFWRQAEKTVRKIRVLVLKLETRLQHLSDNLRGRHVNLDIPERSEYWQNLNGAKQNKEEEKSE